MEIIYSFSLIWVHVCVCVCEERGFLTYMVQLSTFCSNQFKFREGQKWVGMAGWENAGDK